MRVADLPSDLIALWRQCGWDEKRFVEPMAVARKILDLGGSPLLHGIQLHQEVHGLSFADKEWGCTFDLGGLLELLGRDSVPGLHYSLGRHLCPLGFRGADLATAFTNERLEFVILDEGWTCSFTCPSFADLCYWLIGSPKCQVMTNSLTHHDPMDERMKRG